MQAIGSSCYSVCFVSRKARDIRSSVMAAHRGYSREDDRELGAVRHLMANRCLLDFSPRGVNGGAYVVVPSPVILVNPEDHAARNFLKLPVAQFSDFWIT